MIDATGLAAGPAGAVVPPEAAPGGLRGWLDRRRREEAERTAQSAALRREVTARAAVALGTAARMLDQGWVQGVWFHVQGRGCRTLPVGPLELGLLEGRRITGACLVGAVVEATGGPREARSDITSRSLDLLWDALQDRHGRLGARAAERAASPTVRAGRVRELTRWNDTPGRTRSEVLDLLGVAQASGRALATSR